MSELNLSDAEFKQFSDLMRKVAGIDLPVSKKPLVSGRLLKRLRARRQSSFSDYFQLVSCAHEAEEFQRMLDLLTTHETYFFREPKHFDYLAGTVLPQLTRGKNIRIWSAASSTGEEAYSLAMVLMDKLGPSVPWEIFASDISLDVLEKAKQGVYKRDRTEGLSEDYLRRFCLKGIGSSAGTLKIAPEIRERVTFAQVNLNASLATVGQFDVVFLRNVLIYFDIPTKKLIVNRVVQQLRPQGWLFIGHAESLNGITTAVSQERPTIYRRESS